MSTVIASRRYASALLDVAEDGHFLDVVKEDLEKIQDVLGQSRELSNAIKSPLIRGDAKARFLEAIFRNDVGEKTMVFLTLLAKKKRAGLLSEVIDEFNALLDEKRGIVNAVVKSAVALSEDQEKALVDKLSAWSGKTVRPAISLDAALIGGVKVKIGDTILDGSVQHQLQRLKKSLAGDVV